MGEEPLCTKIGIHNKILEQVSDFNYLGCCLSFNQLVDVEENLYKVKRHKIHSKTFIGRVRKTMLLHFIKLWPWQYYCMAVILGSSHCQCQQTETTVMIFMHQ